LLRAGDRGVQPRPVEQAGAVDRNDDALCRARDTIAAVTQAELLRMIQEGVGMTIDVRPSLEYRAAHIPGAISMPVDQMEGRLGELPSDVDIVTYCRGPYCVYAYEAWSCCGQPAGRRAAWKAGFWNGCGTDNRQRPSDAG